MNTSKRYEEPFDEKLGSEINQDEAETAVKAALIFTNGSSSMRPTMCEVVSMLEGTTSVPEIIPEINVFTEELRFKAMRDFKKQNDQSQY